MSESLRRVLVIGSGPIVIGQAAEFDYAGTQACRALREEGVETILVNSNPATIMTDEDIADAVYIEPLTVEVIRRIIVRERPDGLLPTLGGQTGLNLAVQLAEAGILDEYGVRLLGTPLRAIQRAEDRELFKRLLQSIGEPVRRERDRPHGRGGARVRSGRIRCRSSSARPTRSAAPAAASRQRPKSWTRSSRAASAPARSSRCWSSARCSAGKRSSTR